jgi:hypothetical protein
MIGKSGWQVNLELVGGVASDLEVDRWIGARRAELDPTKQAALIQQIARQLQTDVTLIPLPQLRNVYGNQPEADVPDLPERHPAGRPDATHGPRPGRCCLGVPSDAEV